MKKWKNVIMTLGALLWIGAISPEIFIDPEMGCFVNEAGEALTEEEAEELFEKLYMQEDSQVQIVYKSKLWEWILGRLR